MTQPALVGAAIDAVLATGLACLTILAGLAIATPIALGYRAGTELAIRWHTRHILRDAETYAHHPHLRPVIDHADQPRKETP